MIVALAGGVGAAKFLVGLAAVVDPSEITAVVNTGDDTVMHGLYVSPDLDTVTYTLAGAVNPGSGWGRAGETWAAMDELRSLGGDRVAWFNLGDSDLGLHLYRTSRLSEGATLSEVAAEVGRRWGLAIRLLPMSDQRVETRILLDEGEVGFQDYFVRLRHQVPVRGVRFEGVEAARAAPGVLEGIAGADLVLICPSNPVVSIGPVLATGGIGPAVAARRERVAAVSPIVDGRAIKGPADRMLVELGHEASVVGVARMWAPYAALLAIDPADSALAGAVGEAGMRPLVTPSVMHGPAEAAALAQAVLGAMGGAVVAAADR